MNIDRLEMDMLTKKPRRVAPEQRYVPSGTNPVEYAVMLYQENKVPLLVDWDEPRGFCMSIEAAAGWVKLRMPAQYFDAAADAFEKLLQITSRLQDCTLTAEFYPVSTPYNHSKDAQPPVVFSQPEAYTEWRTGGGRIGTSFFTLARS
jgi:hypothetical protein